MQYDMAEGGLMLARRRWSHSPCHLFMFFCPANELVLAFSRCKGIGDAMSKRSEVQTGERTCSKCRNLFTSHTSVQYKAKVDNLQATPGIQANYGCSYFMDTI